MPLKKIDGDGSLVRGNARETTAEDYGKAKRAISFAAEQPVTPMPPRLSA